MRTTAYLFTVCLAALTACSSGSTSPAPTTGSTTSAEVCSTTLGPISPEAGAGDTCAAGATCTQAKDGTYACAATPSVGGW
jgi:hypothetical protein